VRRRLLPLLLALPGCAPRSAPIELHAETPDGSRVDVTLTYPAAACPVSMQPGPCYQYLVRLTPNSSFSPTFVVPPAQPRPELSPVAADSLLARLERQLREARLKGDSINREGVDHYLEQASRGGYSTLCALRIAVDTATFGRVSLRFYDREGRSLFQRDSQATGDQALSPGWTDPADEGHKSGNSWIWKGRLSVQALSLDGLQQGATLQARLEPACRSLDLPV
jgi:hypothetical protein